MQARSQAALEYLATYGWAFLILAIAIGIIYELGYLNPPAVVSSQCILESGKLGCASSLLSEAGMLMVNISQFTPDTLNITAIGCGTNLTGLVMQPIAPPKPLSSGNSSSFFVQCYSSSAPFSGNIGQLFKGYLVLNYTDTTSGFGKSAAGVLLEKVTTSKIVAASSTSLSTTISTTASTTISTTASTTISTTASTTTSTTIPFLANYIFIDDYGRSELCLNTTTSMWDWFVFRGNGAGTNYTSLGTITNGSGYIRVTVVPGTGYGMDLIYYTTAYRATGTFTYRPNAITSALYTSNTLNDPVVCGTPPPTTTSTSVSTTAPTTI